MDFPAGRIRIFLLDLRDGDFANELIVVVGEVSAGPPEETIVGPASRLLVHSRSRFWEVRWESYVVYAVRNESFASMEEGERAGADTLCQRETSALLDYVAKSTWATNDYPGPLQVWALDAMDHCLEVVSSAPPKMKPLDVTEIESRGIRYD